MFIQPIFKLLNGRDMAEWDARHKGALRSAFTNRQWPQARLCQAGMATTANCRLCVAAGLCDALDPSPIYRGTLAHRILTCPATKRYRERFAPKWILEEVRKCTDGSGQLVMNSERRDLLTRAFLKSPEPAVDPPPTEETFEWVKRPICDASHVNAFVDGSRLDAEQDLFGYCARQGWAIAAYDADDRLVAAAHGRTPSWATGIHATELWGLLMAAQTVDPWCKVKVDCQAVQLGAQRDVAWANAPCRTFARAWGPVAATVGEDPGRVVWMPAHNSISDIGHRKLSDGALLSTADVVGNDLVDRLAKQIARRDSVPKPQLQFVRSQGACLLDAAMWIGRATAFANHCPEEFLTSVDTGSKRKFLRDSEAARPRRITGPRRSAGHTSGVLAAVDSSVPAILHPAMPTLQVRGTDCVLRKHLPSRHRATPAAVVRAVMKAKRSKVAQLAVAASSQRDLDNWLAARPPAAVPCVPAAVRLEAVRARVLRKSLLCETASGR